MPDIEIDSLNPTTDPDEVRVKEFDVRHCVFVIPLDAPVPSELADIEMPKGSLYQRLVAIDSEQPEEFSFIPVSGSELLALDRVWRVLQRAKKVFALFDLPGAKYDILFAQAVRQMGIQRIDWSNVAEALAARSITMQRTRDKAPWQTKPEFEQQRRSRVPRSTTGGDIGKVPAPIESDDADS